MRGVLPGTRDDRAWTNDYQGSAAAFVSFVTTGNGLTPRDGRSVSGNAACRPRPSGPR
jgi:hypothetical protein